MKILVVGAHLDDIELACGGTLAKAIEAGHQIKTIVLSKSGYTNYDGRVMRTNEVAVEEGLSALHALGVTDVEILDFPNKDTMFESKTIEAIDSRMNDFNPDIIFAHHPFDTHQSHVGVGKSTIAAARRRNTVFLFEPIAPSGRSYVPFKPQMYVDITSTIDKKIESLKKHKTEYKKFGDDWIEGVIARAGFRGYEMKAKYAEAFEILRVEMSFDERFTL